MKQACQASETALRELQSKGDIDEALRRESEAKKSLEETQKVVEELKKSNSDLQAVLASTSTRAEQIQKQMEECTSNLSIQKQQSSKQLEDMRTARNALEQQLNTARQQLAVTRQQLQESQQQFNQYTSTHPAVTVEELSSLRAASDRLKLVETELRQLKQTQGKKENKKMKGKLKGISFTPSTPGTSLLGSSSGPGTSLLAPSSSPGTSLLPPLSTSHLASSPVSISSPFSKRSSGDLSLPAEKRLSISLPEQSTIVTTSPQAKPLSE